MSLTSISLQTHRTTGELPIKSFGMHVTLHVFEANIASSLLASRSREGMGEEVRFSAELLFE